MEPEENTPEVTLHDFLCNPLKVGDLVAFTTCTDKIAILRTGFIKAINTEDFTVRIQYTIEYVDSGFVKRTIKKKAAVVVKVEVPNV